MNGLTSLPVMAVTPMSTGDHIGGHKYFENIAVHEAEKDWLSVQFPIPLQTVKNILTCRPCDFPEDFVLEDYQIFRGMPRKILQNGDRLPLGNRLLEVIHTPGHSPGHCCFYEPERRYLYSGDLIYKGCLDAFYPSTDPQLFWQSVKRIQSFRNKADFAWSSSAGCQTDMINRIEEAFQGLADKGKLKQGNGILTMETFRYISSLLIIQDFIEILRGWYYERLERKKCLEICRRKFP